MIREMIQFGAGKDAGLSDFSERLAGQTGQAVGHDTRFRDELEAAMKRESDRDLQNREFKNEQAGRENLRRDEALRDQRIRDEKIRDDAVRNRDMETRERIDRENALRDQERADWEHDRQLDRKERDRVASDRKSKENSEKTEERSHTHHHSAELEEETKTSGKIAVSRDKSQLSSLTEKEENQIKEKLEINKKNILSGQNLKDLKTQNKFGEILRAKLKRNNLKNTMGNDGENKSLKSKENSVETLRLKNRSNDKDSLQDSLIKETPFKTGKEGGDFTKDLKSEISTADFDLKKQVKKEENDGKKPIISVEDRRTDRGHSLINEKIVNAERAQASGADKNILRAKVHKDSSDVLSQMESGSKESGEKSAVKEMTFYLKEEGISSSSAADKGKAAAARSAESAFRTFLQDRGNNEIAQNIKFILKNNQQGEIRLILKPESLGKVKINLSMAEKGIKGSIIVENSSTGDIFKENVDRLNTLLKEAGFENSQLDVSVGDDRQHQAFDKEEQKRPFFSERLKEVDDFVLDINKVSDDKGHLDLVI